MLLVAALTLAVAQDPWTKTLPDGHKVTLYAISDSKRFWKPDGTPFTPNIDPNGFTFTHAEAADKRYLTVILRFDTPIKGPWPDASVSIGGTPLPNSRIGPEGDISTPPRKGRVVEVLRGGLIPANQPVGDVTVTCATGPWHTVGTYDIKTKRSTGLHFVPNITTVKRPTLGTDRKPIPGDVSYSIGVKVKAPKGFIKPSEGRRIDAFSDKHVELMGGGSVWDPKNPSLLNYFFETGDPAMGEPIVHARYIALQTRPTYFFTFSGVRLKPKA